MIDKNIIFQCQAFAKDCYSLYEKDPNVWEGHISLVRKYARMLAQAEGVDADLIDIAAMLHDIGKYQGKEGHAEKSYELAKPFLNQLGIEEDEKELILRCIKNHNSKSVNENNPIEIKIMQSADVLGTLFDEKWQEFSRKELSKEKLLKLYEKSQKKLQLESAKKIAAPQIEKLIEVLK